MNYHLLIDYIVISWAFPNINPCPAKPKNISLENSVDSDQLTSDEAS